MNDRENGYSYEEEQDIRYCYPDSDVLINQFDVRDPEKLLEMEQRFSMYRYAELTRRGLKGNFDLKYLQKIHQYLFQDIYPWAGKLRTVNISKGHEFCMFPYIELQFEEMYSKLEKDDFLRQITDQVLMSRKLSYCLSEINAIHPFREGNGRAQRTYFELLLRQSPFFEIDFGKVTKEQMLAASISSFQKEYEIMDTLIYGCLIRK